MTAPVGMSELDIYILGTRPAAHGGPHDDEWVEAVVQSLTTFRAERDALRVRVAEQDAALARWARIDIESGDRLRSIARDLAALRAERDALRVWAELARAAYPKHNVIGTDHTFKNPRSWIVVPREDFDAIRKALSTPPTEERPGE